MTIRKNVGSLAGVAVEVAGWDGAAAEVDLSCVCMFAREIGGGPPRGGLAHVDDALSGHLVRLRAEGSFSAQAGETLLLDRPPAAIVARALLIIGLGAPENWSARSLSPAVRLAASVALGLRVRFAAFAPGMLDSGLSPEQTHGAPCSMVTGLAAALHARRRLQQLDLARPATLARWTFDAGAARVDAAADQFRTALSAVV